MGSDDNACSDLVLIIIALFIPPLTIFLKAPPDEQCGGHFWCNVLLWLFFILPGVLHAIWYVLAK